MKCGWCRIRDGVAYLGLCRECWSEMPGKTQADLLILLLLEAREIVHGLNFIASRGAGAIPPWMRMPPEGGG